MPEVGTEIWLEILSQLPHAILLDLALVNRTFARQCQQVLFRRFEFHPYARESDGSLLLPEPRDMEQALRRLDFWTSEAISPNVRRCDVSQWFRYGSRKFSASPDSEPYALLSTFFSRIGNFPKLVHLTFRDIQLSSAHLTILCGLPALRTLAVDRCEVTGSSDAIDGQTLRVQMFTFADEFAKKDALHPWLPLLDFRSIHTLSLDCNLQGLSKEFPRFAAVKVATLRTEIANGAAAQECIRLLGHFPAIAELKLANSGHETPAKIPNVDPAAAALTKLAISCELLPAFLHAQSAPVLSDLTVLSCSPTQLVSALKKNGSTSPSLSIDSLAIALYDCVESLGDEEDGWEPDDDLKLQGTVTAPRLRTILTSFSSLTKLDVGIWCSIKSRCNTNVIPMNLFTKLPSITSFPPTLITLLIRWTFGYEHVGDVDMMHNADESAFTAVTSRLVRTCPRLQYLWLDGDTMYVYRWRRTPRGSVELEFTEDEANIDALRREVALLHGIQLQPLYSLVR
ncbi:hypothetical protein B0H13DRAFT_1858003 [Mycena leptocephala]|nr:hypothetical protein B0H13DRAFT_1858003 [Mycena leptocephala]